MENTVENNRLIAEFMGVDWQNVVDVCQDKLYESGHRSTDIIKDPEYWSCYNSSWNWLMPVVEKIESLNYNVEFSKNHCVIVAEIEKAESKRITKYSENKIKAVYNACLEFIKWHNANK